MKNLLIAFISIASLSLFSCGNTEVEDGNYSILGSWKYVSEGGTITITRIFKEDNTYYYNAINKNTGETTVLGTYESDGSNLTLTFVQGATGTKKGKYSSTDYELTLTMEDENGPTVYIKQ